MHVTRGYREAGPDMAQSEESELEMIGKGSEVVNCRMLRMDSRP